MSLKSLFIKDNETSENVSEPSNSLKKPVSQPKTVNFIVNPVVTVPTVTVEEKNEFTEFLNEVYKKGNFPGPDYQEFTDAIKNMAAQQVPENMKFSMAYSVFQTQGLTKARLLETGKKYLDLIQSQISEFSDEINVIMNKEVGEKKKKCEQIQKDNAQIEKEIQILNERKNKNNEVIFSITNEINEQTLLLQNKKAAFEAAANDFINEVNGNLEKINSYIA